MEEPPISVFKVMRKQAYFSTRSHFVGCGPLKLIRRFRGVACVIAPLRQDFALCAGRLGSPHVCLQLMAHVGFHLACFADSLYSLGLSRRHHEDFEAFRLRYRSRCFDAATAVCLRFAYARLICDSVLATSTPPLLSALRLTLTGSASVLYRAATWTLPLLSVCALPTLTGSATASVAVLYY